MYSIEFPQLTFGSCKGSCWLAKNFPEVFASAGSLEDWVFLFLCCGDGVEAVAFALPDVLAICSLGLSCRKLLS